MLIEQSYRIRYIPAIYIAKRIVFYITSQFDLGEINQCECGFLKYLKSEQDIVTGARKKNMIQKFKNLCFGNPVAHPGGR